MKKSPVKPNTTSTSIISNSDGPPSFIMMYAPELLKEYAPLPELQSEGVSEEDIANNSNRYQDLLRTLAMRH